jgi:hypothetical protein
MNADTFSRRDFVKTSAAMIGAGIFTPHNFFIQSRKSLSKEVLGHGSHKYKVVQGWGVLDAGQTPVKDCHEMVQDSKGRIVLLTNETKNNVIIYDKSGKLLKTWGSEYPGAHGLTLWKEGGEDFLFITDHDHHEVYKTTIDGKVVMTLKYPSETGAYASANEYKPTETAVAPNGDIYVADGYGKSYIIQYNSKGEYIRHFGGKGEANENIMQSHGVCIDTRDKKNPTILVSSREQNALKKFSMDGKYLATIPLPGAYVCRPVVNGNNIYAAVLVSKMPWTSGSGFVTILDKNDKVISNPGGSEPAYESGQLQKLSQVGSTFVHAHDVCIDNDKNIYVAQWNSGKTYPIKLERV